MQLAAALPAAGQGVKPGDAVVAIMSVFAAGPSDIQAKLEQVLPAWLARHGGLAALEAFAGRGRLAAAQQAIALRWLAAGGRDVQQLTPSAASTFQSRSGYPSHPRKLKVRIR
jgi:hypothetical protein